MDNVCVCDSLQKMDPLCLAVQQQLLSKLQQLLVALHQQRSVIPADRLSASEDEKMQVRRLTSRKGEEVVTETAQHKN